MANNDPGNTNWTDTAFVYTDQSLFSTIPTDVNEYKYMLANTAAHEIGHILGYDHSQAAGMPFMYNGDAMEARIRQDILLGELGEITQQKWTYIADTDFDTVVAKPQVTYIQKESITNEMINELSLVHNYDDSGFNWEDAKEIVGIVLSEVVSSVLQAHSIGLSMLPEVQHVADSMWPSTLRMFITKEESSVLLNRGC